MITEKRKTTKCQCSRECEARVLGRGKKYAQGHNPSTWARERQPEMKYMTAEEFAAHRVSMRAKHGKYATEKVLGKCPRGCGFVDGVRGLQRHRSVCPKRNVK